MKILACVAEKHTKKQISPVYELDLPRETSIVQCVHMFARKLEEVAEIYLDGRENYMDYTVID